MQRGPEPAGASNLVASILSVQNEEIDKMTTITSTSLAEVNSNIRENSSFLENEWPDLQSFLLNQWKLAAGDSTTTWFERLYKQHNEPGRHYHTAVHLKEMLEYVTILEDLKKLPTTASVSLELTSTAFRLATFFHDAVYDPMSSTNERDSADLFQEFCNDFPIDDTLKGIVTTLILATEKHQVIESRTVGKDLQEHFLDIDMAVLGKKQEAYLSYAGLIRKEYIQIPLEVYCEKRAAILESFCSRRIFLSTMFYDALESAAKENLQYEIEQLKKQIIPGE